MIVPETQYARVSDSHIAYQVSGSGPIDVLMFVGQTICVDLMYDFPSFARFIDRFGSFCRLIRFDKRGIGASDPLSDTSQPTLEQWTDDALAVLDAVGSEQAALMTIDPGGIVAFLLAAAHPTRVSHLVLTDPAVYPRAAFDVVEERLDLIVDSYRTGTSANYELDVVEDDFQRWFARARRLGASPSSARNIYRVFLESDLRAVASSIRAPTLIVDRVRVGRRVSDAKGVAALIPSARIVEFPDPHPYLFAADFESLVDEIEEFLTGSRPPPAADDRVFATILFTDIVGSTQRTTDLGDRRWGSLLDAHDGVVQREVTRFQGRVVKSTGDGVLATFDGPARAVRCSQAIAAAVRELKLEMRAGVHAGEVQVRGDDVTGISVTTARRVCDAGGSGELLVSRTVTDLVAGSGLEFDDRGEHELKGVPGRWQLFAVKA